MAVPSSGPVSGADVSTEYGISVTSLNDLLLRRGGSTKNTSIFSGTSLPSGSMYLNSNSGGTFTVYTTFNSGGIQARYIFEYKNSNEPTVWSTTGVTYVSSTTGIYVSGLTVGDDYDIRLKMSYGTTYQYVLYTNVTTFYMP